MSGTDPAGAGADPGTGTAVSGTDPAGADPGTDPAGAGADPASAAAPTSAPMGFRAISGGLLLFPRPLPLNERVLYPVLRLFWN